MSIKLILGDCLEEMKKIPDKSIDLVLTDPPYGIGMDKALHKKQGKYGYRDYGDTNWDIRPSKEYFDEMFRISKNQIIWGGAYFTDFLYPSMGWLVWDKGQRDFSLADGELAWTSFNRALRIKTYARSKAMRDGKRHPTQKSLTIMKWCLLNSTKDGDVVCDPFMGSGTTGLACKELGRNFIGIEKHPPYFKMCELRINQSMQELFV